MRAVLRFSFQTTQLCRGYGMCEQVRTPASSIYSYKMYKGLCHHSWPLVTRILLYQTLKDTRAMLHGVGIFTYISPWMWPFFHLLFQYIFHIDGASGKQNYVVETAFSWTAFVAVSSRLNLTNLLRSSPTWRSISQLNAFSEPLSPKRYNIGKTKAWSFIGPWMCYWCYCVTWN